MTQSSPTAVHMRVAHTRINHLIDSATWVSSSLEQPVSLTRFGPIIPAERTDEWIRCMCAHLGESVFVCARARVRNSCGSSCLRARALAFVHVGEWCVHVCIHARVRACVRVRVRVCVRACAHKRKQDTYIVREVESRKILRQQRHVLLTVW